MGKSKLSSFEICNEFLLKFKKKNTRQSFLEKINSVLWKTVFPNAFSLRSPSVLKLSGKENDVLVWRCSPGRLPRSCRCQELLLSLPGHPRAFSPPGELPGAKQARYQDERKKLSHRNMAWHVNLEMLL